MTYESELSAPLSGTTVIELGQIIAGPIVSLILSDLGATVIKVEQPGSGDRMRTAGTSGDAMFQTMNRNKRSITLDLKSDSGREVYEELAASADVVVENLSPGAVEKLSIGYDDLVKRNPGLVYLSVKGFLDGPYKDRPAMDVVGEAMSGFMRMTGKEGDKPLRAGTSVADFASGLYGTIGILVALQERERTGRGQKITSGIYESISHWMTYWMAYTQFQGKNPSPLEASHPAMSPYDVYESESGEWLFIGIVSEQQWEDLCDILDRKDLYRDDRFTTSDKRLRNDDKITELVASEVQNWDRERLLGKLLDDGIPAAPVQEPSDLVDDPHLIATGLLEETAKDDGKPYQTILTPIQGDKIELQNRRRSPKLGEHTEEVLSDLGFDEDIVEEYQKKGAFSK